MKKIKKQEKIFGTIFYKNLIVKLLLNNLKQKIEKLMCLSHYY